MKGKREASNPLMIALILLVLVIQSCNNKPSPPKINPAFSSYISAFTAGVVSSEATIRIRLTDAFQDEISSDKLVNQGLLEFSPSIDGELVWLDSKTLEFVPSEPLESSKTYNGLLKLHEIMDVPEDLEEFEFQFKTLEQRFSVDIESIKPYNNLEMEWQILKGVVITSDIANNEKVKDLVKVAQNGENLSLTWTHDLNRKVHHFIADSIERKEVSQAIEITWNGDAIGAKDEGVTSQEIPALGDFKILETRVIQQPEQHVLIRFSDPLLPKQNLDGLIVFSGYNDIRTIIEDNEIKIYPPHRFSGNRKLEVEEGIKNILGYKFKVAETLNLSFEDIKPSVEMIANNRTILPSTNGLVFPFRAVNLNAVDVKVIRVYEKNVPQFLQVNHLDGNREMKRVGRIIRKKTVDLNPEGDTDLGQWNTFHLDLNDLIKAEKGAIYRIEMSFRQKHSLYSCGVIEDVDSNDGLTDMDEDWDEYAEEESSYWNYYDEYYYDYYYWDYDYSERDNPCHPTYYARKRPVAKNVFASDLGIIAKYGSDQSVHVAVSNLLTTQAMSNVDVEIYNYQHQLLTSSKTNSEGILNIDRLNGVPFLLIAKKGNERGYLKMDNGSSLSLSKFDVAGSMVKKGLKGFIYGERGVWRPGDTLFLSFILEDEFKTLPKTHPVSFELINPKGQVVERKVRSISENGFFSFISQTHPDAPTGNWNARVKVGGAVFNKSLKIETIKPNRLKINFDFGTETITASDTDIEGEMNVKWLHGSPARNLRAKVGATFKSIRTSFSKYADYRFDDPVRRFHSEEKIIYDERVNEDGYAQIQMDVDLNDRAPGMLKAYFNTKVFEEGGEFSVDRFSIPYAPYDSFVGIKMPKGDRSRGMLLTDKEHEIEIVTVDAQGNPISRNNLEVYIYEVNWRWWWQRSEDNLSRYSGSQDEISHIKGTVNTGKDGTGKFNFQIDYPEWGRYLVRVIDPEGGHATGQTFYIDWPGWAGRAQRENPGGASMLVFSTDKDKYEVGDECTVSFPSSGVGRALLSIESGSKVLDAHWVEAEKELTSYRFSITEAMAPNVYLNITLVQPHEQTANDLPIRLYGVMPIFVENPETHLYPIIDMAESLRPEEEFSVKVSEKEGKEMTYTLAVVDEGLLDLTRFKTPDAWSHFFAREALGVKTWDIYDQVIGAYGSDLEKLLSLGGDGEVTEKGKNKANRFKPVVMFLGPYTLEAGKSQTHKLEMPNYVGSVRTMVVAGNMEAYGKAEKTTPVKKPLMVLATLPRVLGPSEEVKLPVTVFAMEKQVKNVEVSIEANKMFDIEGKSSKTLRFDKIGDQVINFDLKVANKLGIGTVKVTTKSGNEKATYEIEIDIRNPNPEVTDVIEAVVDAGETWNIDYELIGMEGTNEAILEVSSIPPVDFSRRMRYLIGYPHGCVEQTTSKAFPQLFMADVMDLSPELEQKTAHNVSAAITKLKRFQNVNGGLSYWPGQSNPNDWGTTYAGHFMLEAEQRGYALPAGFKSAWINYQKNAAREWRYVENRNNYYWRYTDLVQAYRLYTLALANEPELSAMNRLREKKNLTVQARWRLAAAYQLAGQPEVAKELVENLSSDIEDYRALSYHYGSTWRDKAMIIETLTLMGERKRAANLVKDMAKAMGGSRWFSTQATAYSLMALSKFAKGETGQQVKYQYTINGKRSNETLSNKAIAMEDLPVNKLIGNLLDFKNKTDNVLFARIILSGKPLTGEDKAASNDLRLAVEYLDMNGSPIDVTRLEQGTDFMAKVRITHPGIRFQYEELALTQIFPSGWEIHNTRLDEVSSVHSTDIPTYQDIRDDRVYSYFSLYTNKSKTYTVLLNSSYQGKFYLPSVSCEAMYDETINARSKGQWVEVLPVGGTSVTEK